MGDEHISDRPAQAFDYSTLEESQRLFLQEKEKDIKTRLAWLKQRAEEIVAIGQRLIEDADNADELLKHLTKADLDGLRQEAVLLAFVEIIPDNEGLLKTGWSPY